jgi:hypothetical protein
MNNLMNYLLSRLGKKTCPITSLEQVIDFSFNSPWREYYVLKFKDGTVIELIEKPKLK